MPDPAERMGVEAYFGVVDFLRNAAKYNATLDTLEKKTSQYGSSVSKSTAGADSAWGVYGRTTDQVVDDLRKSLNEGEQEVRDFGDENRKTAQNAATSWQQFTSSTIGQVAKLKASLDAGRYMFQAFMKPFQQFIALGTEGAGMLRMERNLRRMTGSQEAYNEAIMEMRDATRGTIKDAELISSAFKIMNLGLADTAEQAAKVARNVTLLGRASGQVPSPEAAMQVFSLMMSNQSKMRLDAFALSIGEVDARIENLKKTMGVSQEEAFRLAVYELMDEKVESMGLSVEDAATMASRMNAQFGNVADSIKTMIVPEFESFMTILSGFASKIVENTSGIEKWYRMFVGAARGMVYQLGDVAMAFVLAGRASVAFFKGDIDGAKEAAGALGDLVKKVMTLGAVTDSMQYEMSRMYDDMATSAEDSIQKQADAMKQAAAEAGAAVAEIRTEWDAKLTAAHDAAEKRIADITIKETEKAIDAVIAAQRRREDAARDSAKRIEQIEMQYAQSVAKAMDTYTMAIASAVRQRNARLLQIEEDFQRKKRDIQERYEMEEWEAIASRDATALLKARRTRDKALRDAEEAKNVQEAQANTQYAEQERSAREALARQEQAARESYDEQKAALQESLAEKEEAQRLSQERQAEDAKRAREREMGRIRQDQGQQIAELYIHYNDELSASQQHHNEMLIELQRYLQEYAAQLSYYGHVGSGMPGTMGFAKGGSFIASSPTRIMVGEGGKPELVIVQPLDAGGVPTESTVNHKVTGQVDAQVNAIIQQGMEGFEGRLQAAMTQALDEVFR